MKIFKSTALFLAILFGWQFHVYAQTPTFSCTTSGSSGGLTWTCPNSTAPVVTPPFVTTPVVTAACSDAQTAVIGGKVFHRQCNGSVAFNSANIDDYYGALTDFGTVLHGGKFPSYASGYTPTYTINSGYFVSLQFTPQVAGAFQLSANQSFGDGGLISLSTAPGSLTVGSPGYICGYARQASNAMYVATTATACHVTIGQTYYVNFADSDTLGDQLCAGGKPNTCASSKIAYTLYTSGQ